MESEVMTVRTLERHAVISFAALFTSSAGIRVAIERSARASWSDLLAAIIYDRAVRRKIKKRGLSHCR